MGLNHGSHSRVGGGMIQDGSQKPVINGVKWGPYKWQYKWLTGSFLPLYME